MKPDLHVRHVISLKTDSVGWIDAEDDHEVAVLLLVDEVEGPGGVEIVVALADISVFVLGDQMLLPVKKQTMNVNVTLRVFNVDFSFLSY